jgi:ATP-dependent 26S proteasome regulatory subunit
MSRREKIEFQLITRLLEASPDHLDEETRIQHLQAFRGQGEAEAKQLDDYIVNRLPELRAALEKAGSVQSELKAVVARLTSPAWHQATFLRALTEDRAIVQNNNSRHVVSLATGVDLASLTSGDEVFLSSELNCIMCRAPYGACQHGDTACFDRRLADGRLVVRWRDEEKLVAAGGLLLQTELKPGDLVRFDSNIWMATERIEQGAGWRFMMEAVTDIGRDQVGGQQAGLDRMLAAFTSILLAPEKATRYGRGGRRSIFLYGPPGCGKTLLTKIAAAELQRLSGKKCRFSIVKPAEWEDPYVGVTQQNIRNCFRALAEAAADGFAVLFLDEIEAVGRVRGHAYDRYGDKHLAALLVELEGFSDRKNVLIIAASNRKDLIDPALLERLSAIEIHVERPDMRAARAIFSIHLPPSLPFSPNGATADATRNHIIETAVSRLYSPNADNEICVLKFRDGRTRTVAARELASGRLFQQVCEDVCDRAFLRDVRQDDAGLRVSDMEDAVDSLLQRLRTTLTPRNVHAYLGDLPQDVDVVSAEPIVRKVAPLRRYLNGRATA